MRFEMQSRDPVTDQEITVLLDSDDVVECISYGAGYKVEVHTKSSFHKIGYAEYQRIQPLLMGETPALSNELQVANAHDVLDGIKILYKRLDTLEQIWSGRIDPAPAMRQKMLDEFLQSLKDTSRLSHTLAQSIIDGAKS